MSDPLDPPPDPRGDALRESEARYRALAAAAIEGVAIHESSRIVEVNDAFLRMFGYTRAEALAMTIADFIAPEARAQAVADTLRGSSELRQYTALHKDGHTFPFEVRGRPITYQGRAARVVVGRDLGAQLEREAALRVSEERFRVVARATHDALWEQDLATGAVWRSDAFCTLFGYPREAIGGDIGWWAERVHPDDLARVEASIEAQKASGAEVIADEYRFRRADGGYAQVFDRGVLLRDAIGRPSRVIGAMMDVSERRAIEARLLFADRMAALGTLAGGVAHEINNPLSYVIANLGLVAAGLRELASGAAPEGARASTIAAWVAALDEAREGAQRVQRIVSDLKTFARTGDEQARGDAAPRRLVELRSVLEAALHLSDHEIRRRARLVRDIGEIPAVLGDEARLGQLFLNLVLHAAHAIPAGAPAQHEIRVVARRDVRGRAVVEVHDTGPGIPPEAIGRVFDPFFASKPSGGAALGLSVCHGIAAAHGGEISVASRVGVGSTFTVALPAAPPGALAAADRPGFASPGAARSPSIPPPRRATTPPPALAAPGPPEGEAGRSGRILIVDDEPLVGRMVERALGRDHHVVAVTSGLKALARLEAGERFDLILCDLMMPEMTGMDLHERITRAAPDQAAAMVFLTGGAFTPRAREFLAERPCLEKPFDLAQLEELVRERLG